MVFAGSILLQLTKAHENFHAIKELNQGDKFKVILRK